MRNLLYTFLVLFFMSSLIAQEALLTPSDGNPDDEYGYSVAHFENYAVIGCQNKAAGGTNRGAVYLYTKNNDLWEELTILTAPDAMNYDNFGHSVAINGDYLIVGAHSNDGAGLNSGAAYIFHKEGVGWQFQAKLTPDDATQGQTFGISVDINENYAVVGANHSFVNGSTNVGAAYVFHRVGEEWTQQSKLTPSDGSQNDFFGQSVAIDGNKVVISAHFNNSCGNNTGAAYFFTREGDTWTESIKVAACDAQDYDSFGSSVDIYGDYAIIGAFGDDDRGSASGSAYIFHYKNNMWMQMNKLTASNGGANDKFGYSVSINDNIAAIGAHKKGSGTIYIFKKNNNNWEESQIITSEEISEDAELGKSVCLYNDMILTGAPMDDNVADDGGAALLFTIDIDSTVLDTKEVHSFLSKENINIHPNPATHNMTIDIDNNETIMDVEVINNNGQRMLHFTKYQPSIDISILPSGLYFVKIRTDKRLYGNKLIVKR